MSYDRINIDGPGRLFVGGAPQPKDRMQNWADALVLCAAEYQPGEEDLEFDDVEILRVNLGDVNAPMTPENMAKIFSVSQKVARRLNDGGRVVVTCFSGLNRSCLIAGMAMRMIGMSADDTVNNLRAARGENGLCNETFERIVRNTMPLVGR